ncbi:Putative zinc-RING and/or ribbon,Zinc finger, PHD-type,Zinc finger, RING/FYVE/PHD-type,Protein kinase C- [Cinara cedri]|uniref:Zinc-RING and/or ribbon,Zinc finger, PHD-type,Zinc finger, RING/FYVE/PHD-type,Protein kinase C n=1 Tax=Cinara cedri TaxID=506608 RepID=A0A5E4NR84_9HEMI|nr:Putative zinc-RING and/or ribbon,Zinc finger, PHD-type,Zinc finger, RING/FYVE/PHD-type,Protein kinase C- [Cinara cedri]
MSSLPNDILFTSEMDDSVISLSSSDSASSASSTPMSDNFLTIINEDDLNENILEQEIEKCNKMIITTKEYSQERLRLVRRLVELRLKFTMVTERKVLESDDLINTNTQVVYGHHLSLIWKSDWLTTNFCDVCAKSIWKNMHQFYKCIDCGYYCHVFCMENIKRICTAIRASEHSMILTICPYSGLLTQDYKCAECQSYVRIRNIKVSPEDTLSLEARLCDYDGKFYCPLHHWNKTAVIPARVVCNWQFDKQYVSQASFQLLEYKYKSKVYDLEKHNPKLFMYLESLSQIKNIKNNVFKMKKYLVLCKVWNAQLKNISSRCHEFLYDSNLYSMKDLIEIKSGIFLEDLLRVVQICEKHIRVECEICKNRGYICEICKQDKIIFPFDEDVYSCDKCHNVYHNNCCNERNFCPKCKRIENRSKIQEYSTTI